MLPLKRLRLRTIRVSRPTEIPAIIDSVGNPGIPGWPVPVVAFTGIVMVLLVEKVCVMVVDVDAAVYCVVTVETTIDVEFE